MLLSKSELFLVGLVSGVLTKQPLDPPAEENYEPSDYSPPTVYDQLIQLAEACAAGDRPIAVECDESADDIDIDTLVWAKAGRDHTTVDCLAARQAMATLAGATADLRAQFGMIDNAEHVARRFDEILSEDAALLYGYTPSRPGNLYGVRTNGTVRIVYRVTAMPQGTLRNVLRILLPHVALPPAAFMSLAVAGDAVPEWHDNWLPSVWSLHYPLGTTDRAAAIAAIESNLVGTAREDAEFRLGCCLGAVLGTLDTLQPWLSYELTTLYHALGNTRVIHFEPANTTASNDTNSNNEPNDELSSSTEADSDSFSVAFASSDSRDEHDAEEDFDWAGVVKQAAFKACTQVGLGVAVPTLASPTKSELKKLQGDLRQAIGAAKELGLDTAIAGLTNCASLFFDLLREDEDEERLPRGTLLQGMFDRRELLGGYTDRLRVLLAFVVGELRLGNLLHDGAQRGLAPQAFAGWMNLNKNLRDSVRVGLEMLSNGTPPFVVINALQPTLEAMARRLVAAHLTGFRGADLHKALQALLTHAEQHSDKDLEAYVRVAMALRRLRNGAVHEHERTYDKHDATFFAQGLAILLRAVS